MGNCKDCEHWNALTKGKGAWQLPSDFGLCARIRTHEEPVNDGDLVVASDLSGCGSLRTRGDFGCVLLEIAEGAEQELSKQEGLTFTQAFEALATYGKHRRMRRATWPEGQYVFFPGGCGGMRPQPNDAPSTVYRQRLLLLEPTLGKRTGPSRWEPWHVVHADLLADDWQIAEEFAPEELP